jgi:hypothetical protein
MTKKPIRQLDGWYYIKNKKFKELFGSREQVYNETAYKTSGNLTKKDLFFNKNGRIVSAKKHKTATAEKRLEKYGYSARKGRFGYVRKTQKKRTTKSFVPDEM